MAIIIVSPFGIVSINSTSQDCLGAVACQSLDCLCPQMVSDLMIAECQFDRLRVVVVTQKLLVNWVQQVAECLVVVGPRGVPISSTVAIDSIQDQQWPVITQTDFIPKDFSASANHSVVTNQSFAGFGLADLGAGLSNHSIICSSFVVRVQVTVRLGVATNCSQQMLNYYWQPSISITRHLDSMKLKIKFAADYFGSNSGLMLLRMHWFFLYH